MNFYKHHIGDYDSHTIELTWTQDLVYRRLLSAYYLRERPLPDNFPILCRMVKAQEASQKTALRYVLERYFTRHEAIPKVPGTPVADTPATWHNARADQEIEQYQAQCLANRRTTQQRIVKRNDGKNATNRSPNQNQIPDMYASAESPTRIEAEPDYDYNPQTDDETEYLSQPSSPRKGNGNWWRSNEGIDAIGRELNLTAKPGEDYPTFKSRIFQAINEAKRQH